MIVTNNVDDREMSFSRGVIELSVSSYTFLTLYPSDFVQEGQTHCGKFQGGGGKSKSKGGNNILNIGKQLPGQGGPKILGLGLVAKDKPTESS